MAAALKLSAKKRTLFGRKVARLRRQQMLPANIFGKGIKSLAIELPQKEFQTVFKQTGETGIIQLTVDKEIKARPVLVANVQVDPVSEALLHIDFRQVDLTQKLILAVPLEFIGEAPAVNQGGILIKLVNEVEIEAFPEDLPDKLTVDLSNLTEIGQSLDYKAIKLESTKIKLAVENPDEIIAKIEVPSKEEEPVPAEVKTEDEVKPEVNVQPGAAEKAETPQNQDQDKPDAPNKD